MIKTCDDMEKWIKDNAASKVDGTFQQYVFRFVALQKAHEADDYNTRETMCLFLDGVPKMDAELATDWIEMWRESEAEIIAIDLYDVDSVDDLTPADRAGVEQKVNDNLVKMLVDYFKD